MGKLRLSVNARARVEVLEQVLKSSISLTKAAELLRVSVGNVFHVIARSPANLHRSLPRGGVAGAGAALGETTVGGRLLVREFTTGSQANVVQLTTTGASRWSSPGHPAGKK